MEIDKLRILVTGGAGYIGSILIPKLLDRGAQVTVVDDLIFGQPRPTWYERVNFIEDDLRDDKILDRAIKDCQAVVHLAAIVGEPACRKDPELASDINIYLTKKINKRRGNIPLIFFSSTSIYGEIGGAICDETSNPTPKSTTPYSMHKLKAEKIITPTDNWLIFRPATAFGVSPRQRLDILINELTFQAVKEGKIELFNPEFNRTFIHVSDLSQAVIFGLENFDRLKNNIFNIGADNLNITKRQITDILKNKIKFDLTMTDGNSDPDKRDFIIKYDKIKNAGFTPAISLEQGIDEMISHFSNLPAGREYYNTNQELSRVFRDKLRTNSYRLRHALIRPRNTIYQLLRKSENIFKTDMVYLAKSGFWLNSGQMISATATFLLSLAYANLLTPETYGTYKYVLSVFGLLSITTLPGIHTAVSRAAAKNLDGSFVPGLKAKIKWGTLGGLASLGLALFYWLNQNTQLSLAFLISASFLPLMESLQVYNAFLQGKKKFKTSSQYTASSQIIATIILISTVFITSNLAVILLSYFISWTLIRIFCVWLTMRQINSDKPIDPEMLKYGKHLTIVNIIGTIADYLDKMLLFHFIGAAEVAIYTVAIAPLDQIKNSIGNIGAVSFPKFAQKTWSEIKNSFWQKMLIFGLLISVITIFYILVAPFLYSVFFPKYISSINYSQIYAISLASLILLIPLNVMQAHKMEKQLYSYSLIYPIPHIILMTVLTYYYGLMGLIISRVINRYFDLFLVTYLLKRSSK